MTKNSAPVPPSGSFGQIPRVTPNEEATRHFLTQNKWPIGFQNLIISQMTEKIPLRFFICDDSGSMFEDDGQHLVSNGTVHQALKCTR